MYRRFFLICGLFLAGIYVFAQSESKAKTDIYQEVLNIRRGIILVRLQTKSQSIRALNTLGNSEGARHIAERQRKENMEIKAIFRVSFTFTHVAFFYSDDSGFIKAGQFEGYLLNDSLVRDSSIVFDADKPIYILDIGDVYFPAFGSHMLGLVLMNDQFEPLDKPFPYFVRERSGIFFMRRTNRDMILLFQKNLYRLLNRNEKKEE